MQNLIPSLATSLGIVIGEPFKLIDALNGKELWELDDSLGELFILRDYGILIQNQDGSFPEHPTEKSQEVFFNLLQGKYIVKSHPWIPTKNAQYWCIYFPNSLTMPTVHQYTWTGDSFDFIKLRAGVLHQTKVEAMAYLLRDYQKLTNKTCSQLSDIEKL